MANILLNVESNPGDRRSSRLTISEDAITIDAERFPWATVDRISYTATVLLAMGFNQGGFFAVAVGAGDRRARFLLQYKMSGMLRNDRLTAIRDEQADRYTMAVALLEAYVGDRLVAETVRALRGGGSVEIGGLRLDRHGLSKRGLFGEKSARWQAIDSTHVFDGAFLIWADGNRRKPALSTSHAADNVVLLPRIIAAMGGPQAPL